jgi:hypothetical protein
MTTFHPAAFIAAVLATLASASLALAVSPLAALVA